MTPHLLIFLFTYVTLVSSYDLIWALAFVINHSLSYSCAALFSWSEYWLGVLLLGRRKFCFPFCAGGAAEEWSLAMSAAGVALAVLGQVSCDTYIAVA
jgi:hypothetical protein